MEETTRSPADRTRSDDAASRSAAACARSLAASRRSRRASARSEAAPAVNPRTAVSRASALVSRTSALSSRAPALSSRAPDVWSRSSPTWSRSSPVWRVSRPASWFPSLRWSLPAIDNDASPCPPKRHRRCCRQSQAQSPAPWAALSRLPRCIPVRARRHSRSRGAHARRCFDSSAVQPSRRPREALTKLNRSRTRPSRPFKTNSTRSRFASAWPSLTASLCVRWREITLEP